MQLATVLRRTDIWSHATALRIVRLVETPAQVEPERAAIKAMMDKFRFEADILVLSVLGGRVHPIAAAMAKSTKKLGPIDGPDHRLLVDHPAVVNEQVRYHCVNTCVCFMALPDVPRVKPSPSDSQGLHATIQDAAYMQGVDMLTRDLPPTVLVAASGSTEFVTNDL